MPLSSFYYPHVESQKKRVGFHMLRRPYRLNIIIGGADSGDHYEDLGLLGGLRFQPQGQSNANPGATTNVLSINAT